MPPKSGMSEQDILAHRKFADQVVDTIGDCIKVLDLDGRLTMMNEPGMRAMEIDDFATCQNATWSTFWEGKSGEAARAAFELARTGKPASFEGPCCTMKGTPKYWHVLVTPVRTDKGDVEGVLVVSRDVTDRRNAEVAAEQAKQYAESANRAKDEFLAVLSHELRTPLSPVVMAISALKQDATLSPHQQEVLEMIGRNVDLEVRLIDDMLDLSRVINGKMRLYREPVKLHELTKDVSQICISDLNKKQIKIEFDFAADSDDVFADPARLRQVFWNLLKNSVKFSNEGSKIRLTSRNPKPGTIEITVIDEGVGIPPDMLPNIFNPFDQGQSGTTRSFGGLGLGLAIVRAVVELHGGKVWAESDGAGKGARLVVQLPVVAAQTENTTDENVHLPNKNLRILVVEDHADTAAVLMMLLKSTGHHVKTAGTAAAALKVAETEPLDLVVSDLGLPDTTGYDLMRQLHVRFGIKGIAMSGYGMDDDIRKSRDAGFVEHIVKPVNFGILDQIIRRVAGNA
ncbi:MAG TPA: ATP-binding protein [Tepidisphaeraceae bacterium]|nr:ATP-binding protein [Tepidisphaeraceae bacterium]